MKNIARGSYQQRQGDHTIFGAGEVQGSVGICMALGCFTLIVVVVALVYGYIYTVKYNSETKDTGSSQIIVVGKNTGSMIISVDNPSENYNTVDDDLAGSGK